MRECKARNPFAELVDGLKVEYEELGDVLDGLEAELKLKAMHEKLEGGEYKSYVAIGIGEISNDGSASLDICVKGCCCPDHVTGMGGAFRLAEKEMLEAMLKTTFEMLGHDKG